MRRAHERFEVLAQLQLSAGGAVSLVPVVTISAGGVLLGLEEGSLPRATPGDRVSVFMDVGTSSGGAELCVSLEAEVIRVSQGSAGRSPSIALMWTSEEPESVAQLAAILAHMRDQGS